MKNLMSILMLGLLVTGTVSAEVGEKSETECPRSQQGKREGEKKKEAQEVKEKPKTEVKAVKES